MFFDIRDFVSVIHSVHDYQSCITMSSKPKNVSRMSLQVRMHKQNVANGKIQFSQKIDKCPLAKMFPFEAILVSYSIQIMTLSYQNHNFTLTVEGMIHACYRWLN